ncbi:hypothetical protein FRC02_004487 [Tulasnella sp. 418]|nr:hypothetical protein FRC02_004487 [Tulasnella sp. 418]
MSQPPQQSGNDDSSGSRMAKIKSDVLARGKACLTCRERKVKCDGKQPVCTPCGNSRRDCVYATKKRGPGAGSVVALRGKLSLLEERMNSLIDESSRHSAEVEASAESFNMEFAPGMSVPSMPLQVTEIPPEDRDYVLEVLFRVQHRVLSNIDRDYIFERLAHPDPNERPHPGLISALLLVGVCYSHALSFTRPIPATIPSMDDLLAQAHIQLRECLGNVDRILDFLQGTALVCHYLFRQGRLQEAQYMSASTSRLAISCRIHQIDATVLAEDPNTYSTLPLGQSKWDGTLLGRPKSSAELGQRIAAFWEIFINDKVLSIVTGLLSSFDTHSAETHITTAWPRSAEEYRSREAFSFPYSSMDDLFNIPAGIDPTAMDIQSTTTLKGIVLLERSNRLLGLSSIPRHNMEAHVHFFNQLKELREAVDRFRKAIPLGSDLAPSAPGPCYSYIDVAHMMMHVADININRSADTLCEYEQFWDASTLHDGRVEAAKRIVGLSQHIIRDAKEPLEMEYRLELIPFSNASCVLVGFFLTPAAIVMIEHMRLLKEIDDEEAFEDSAVTLHEAEKDLACAIETLVEMTEGFPILGVQLEKIQSLRE